MYKHIVINSNVLTPVSEEHIKKLLDTLVLDTIHNGITMGVDWWQPASGDQVYITVTPKGASTINYDVLLACFYSKIEALPTEFPELAGNVRVCKRDASDYHGWFSTTDDCIRFNMTRQDQYMLRECYEAQGARGHVGFCELKQINSLRVFGEPNLARDVLKMVRKEATAKSHFVDLRPGSKIMNLCGSKVMVLVEASNGHFQIINEGIRVSELEVYNAERSPYKNVNYSFLYNHPLFQ